MDLPADSILSEHHVEIARNDPHFSVELPELKPYLISEGNWYLLPLHFSSTETLTAEGSFNGGFELVSYQVTSGNNKPLPIFHVCAKEFEDKNRCMVFDNRIRPKPISHKTDKLHFLLRSVGGHPVNFHGGQVLLGLALLSKVKE